MAISKKKIIIWAGWAISLFFILWAFMSMDMAKVWDAMKMADYRWVIPAAIFNLAQLVFRAERWTHFIAPIKPVRLRSSLFAMSVGFMANMVLPARIGEFVRAYALANKENIPKSSAFGTVVIERAFDGMSIVVLMTLVFAFVTPTAGNDTYWEPLKIGAFTAGVFFTLFFGGLYMFHRRVRAVAWFIEKTISLLPEKHRHKTREILESFRQGFDSIDHGHRLFKIILWSAVIWGTAGLYNYFFFMAFGLNVPFSACFLVLLTQVLGIMIPSAPGFVGVHHAATIAGLAFFGVDGEVALSVALALHIVLFLTLTVPGLVFLWLEQYSFSQVQNAAE